MKKCCKFFYVFLLSAALILSFSVSDFFVGNKVKAEEVLDSSKLSSLVVEGFETGLTPSFSSDVIDYTLSISSNIIDLNIITEKISEGATVSVSGNTYLKNNTGDITVTVTNPSAPTQTTYTIHYTKDLTQGIEKTEYKFTQKDEAQPFKATMTGMYKIELWGAQGGHPRDYNLNLGGYTSGEIMLPMDTELFVYVGKAGSSSLNPTFNGGGAGGASEGANAGYSGGGATDIRLKDGEWDNPISLASRIMVAAGAGGLSGSTNYDNAGGHSIAGGLYGYAGGYYSGHDFVNQNGGGAYQIYGGTAGVNIFNATGTNESGVFGKGGTPYSTSTQRGAGGGGGGYYGGGAGGSALESGYGHGGGGGSSYISGHRGSIAVTGEENLDPRKDENDEYCLTGTTDLICSLHYSGYKFSRPVMIDGAGYSWGSSIGELTEMPTHNGKSTMVGNEGDGYAKITLLSLPSDDNYLSSLTASSGTWNKPFNPQDTVYDLTLSAYTAKFTLDGVTSDEYASVTGFTEYSIALGETKRINIIVVSASGISKTYRVNVTRSELELSTSSTKLRAVSIEQDLGPITIDFQPLVYNYEIEIDRTAMEVKLVGTPFDDGATVNYVDNEYLINDEGDIKIVVTKEGLEATTYTIRYKKGEKSVMSFDTTTFSYTGNPQEYVVPYTTAYKIQLWGGSGEGSAYGAYTEGRINLTAGETIYFYVGNKYSTGGNKKTFNNGTGSSQGYNGGGSTDVRLVGGAWDSFDSLKSRIMVAGAGGSGSGAGAAGGLKGYNGGGTIGGTQTSYGPSGYTTSYFGIANGGCTGGGGYYPGAGSPCASGAGGGSSYISGHDGCIAISDSSTSFSNVTPSSDSVHHSGYQFTDTMMVDGKGYRWTTDIASLPEGMPTTSGNNIMYGNSGAGYAAITVLDLNNDDYMNDISTNIGTWDKPFSTTTYEYNITLDKYESKIMFVGTTSDENATVFGLEEYSINPGQTKRIEIIVTAISGRMRTYKFNVTRNSLAEGERNTKLYDLYIDGVRLNKPFTSMDTEYAIEISENIYDLEIHALPYDNNVEIEIHGNEFITDDRGTITVKVIAKDADQTEVPPTTYYIRFDKYDPSGMNYIFDTPGAYETFVVPYSGNYIIELWGAQGGSGNHQTQPTPGKGAYTKGTINLLKDEELYIYVGEKGNNSASVTANPVGGWNGGGNGSKDAGNNDSAGAGGGATDVRLVATSDPTIWNELPSLKSRIMVAAGGGGAHSTNTTSYTDGMAGGALAVTGQLSTWTSTWTPVVNQTTGYAFGYGISGKPSIYDHGQAGGGGGYYGGVNSVISNYSGRSSGGSSFISGHLGAVALASSRDLTPRKDSQGVPCITGSDDITCSYHYSGYIFTDTVMYSGLQMMPTYNGLDRMTGNTGNGYAKITNADIKSQNAYLDDLRVMEYDYSVDPYISIDFDPLEEEYNIVISKYTRSFKVEATPSDSKANVVNLGIYDIEPDEEKTIKIIVTAEAGNTKTYTLHVTREQVEDEHNVLLKNLTIDKYDLNEKFHSEKEDYTVDIYTTEIDLVINYTKYDSETVVNVVGNKYVADDTGVITVTAKHIGLEDKVYTITYRKINPTMEEQLFSYKGEYQTFVAPLPAKYKIEAYGASGGGSPVSAHTSPSSGGLGGYAQATFGIKKGQKLYIYAGGKGTYGAGSNAYGGPLGGWNGGGNGGNNGSGSGGGATDVRLIPTSALNIWNEPESLYSRIIVAGGAGGADNSGGSLNGSDDGSGGSGAGLKGQGAWYNGSYVESYGGTQTSGNALGQGGHVTTSTDTGGAGGGYWGGLPTNYGNGGAGAGSSYIKNYPGADTTYLDYQGDIKYFNGSFGTAVNNGDGFVRISFIALSSDNAYLKELSATTDLGPLDFEEIFNPKETKYTLWLDKYTEIFTINGTLSSLDSTVTGLGKYTIDPGQTKEIPIVVTSEAGTTKTYIITVKREGFKANEHTTKLRYLTLDDYALKEDFYSSKYDYTLNVYSNEIDSFIHPVAYDDEAIITIIGDKYIKRSPGTITIVVSLPDEYVDEDEEDTLPSTYTITYTKVYTKEPSKNDYLSNLETSVGTMSPDFDRLTDKYTVYLGPLDSGTRLVATADDSKGVVTGSDIFYQVNPGETKEVKIIVTSDYGTSRTYTVDITREEYTSIDPSSLLKSLVIEGYETDIDFLSEVTDYELMLPKGEIDLTINAIPYDEDAVVDIVGDKYLPDTDGYVTITVSREGIEPTEYRIHYTKYDNYVETLGYTGDYQTFVVPYTGIYTFELWGAQGGTSMSEGSYTHTYSRVGGNGGYTKGTIELEKDTKLYIYVGGKGENALDKKDSSGGYNGGGNGTHDHSDNESGAAGGGATDIRLVPGVWDNANSLASRIMVAAGGGGAAYNQVGSYAGGLVGGSTPYVSGATQTTGYKFGLGEHGVWQDTNVEVAGGGGGYYGGNAKSSGVANTYQASGAGGSSFISGYTGSVAITSMTDITPRNDSEGNICINGTTDNLCSIHYSGLSFTKASMFGGNESQPTFDGNNKQTGNTGNGYAKISMELSQDNYLNSLSSDYGVWDLEFTPTTLNYVIHLTQYEAYLNLTGTLSNSNSKVTGLNQLYEVGLGETITIPIVVTAPNGDTKTYRVVAVRDNYTDLHSTKLSYLEVVKYEEGYLTPKFTPINNTYTISIDSSEAEIYVAYEKFDETANVQIFGDGRIIGENGVITVVVTAEDTETTTYTISYVLESVPEGTEYAFDHTGDYQTFVVPTTGYYLLELWGAQGGGNHQNSELGTGGKGGYSTGTIKLYKDQVLYVYVGGTGSWCGNTICTAAGGFNGGGDGNKLNVSTADPSAGGGGATDIRTELNNLYTRFIVAGGGGGGGMDGEAGGAGGGNTGITNYGAGGTQTGGYSFGYGSPATAQTANATYGGPGGGGGWYGGSCSSWRGAGGGSGFILTRESLANVPAGYKLGEDWFLKDAYTVAGNGVMPTTDHQTIMYGKDLNGYALITLIDKTSRNNYLVNLESNYGTWDKPFVTDIQEYTLSLDAYTPKFTLSGMVSDPEATISGLGIYEIEPGEEKIINVIVTSTSGDTRTYKVTVNRAEFTDAHSTYLSNLILNDGTGIDLLPEFNSKITDYTIKLFYNLTDLEVIPTAYDEHIQDSIIIKGNEHLNDDEGLIIIVVKCDEATPSETVYKIRYTKDRSLDNYKPTEDDIVTNYSYTGSYQTFVAPKNGDYVIELWGAQGNYLNNGRSVGGKGAYTYGILPLEAKTKLYVYVGQNRLDITASWNAGTTGGGSSDTTNGGGPNGYGGGGATDIRTVPTSAATTWNEIASLYSRIMVAAGGGGASNYAYPVNGGAAGALVGFDGKNGKYPTRGVANIPPTGGTQTSGGATTRSGGATIYAGAAGGFGTGGNGQSSYGAAGGGGYWNGGGGGHSDCSVDSGAGGSCYISGYLGSVAIANAGSTTPRTDTSGALCANGTEDITCSYHYSGHIFKNATMLSGADIIPSYNGGYTTGNSGNGYARITQILIDKDNYLETLTSDYGTFDKTFEPTILDYTLHLDYNAMAINLTGTVSNSDATVTGLGYYEIELGEERDIKIIVTAENGESRTYTIHVVRDNYDGHHTTKLSKLHLEAHNIGILTPAFNSAVNDYTIELFFNNVNVEVVYETFDEEAIVRISGERHIINSLGEILISVSLPEEFVDANDPETQPRTYVIRYTKDEMPDEIGRVYNFPYDAKNPIQTFTPSYNSLYQLEAWGAQGGSSGGTGGYGAYSTGVIELKKGQVIYVVVGGAGGAFPNQGGSESTYGTGAGGYNGGGNGNGYCGQGGGGGATHFATETGILSTFASKTEELLLVAAGGGGAYHWYRQDGSGNSGGGYTVTSAGNIYTYGSFGQGGSGLGGRCGGGGGGGGYTGGNGGGNTGYGGGGSSYIANELLISSVGITKAMYCYNCTQSSEESTFTISTTGTSELRDSIACPKGVDSNPISKCAKSGTGYARISNFELSYDNYLTDITSTAGTFNRVFDPLVNEYTLTLGLYDEWYTLDATLSDVNATILGLGEYRLDVGETDTKQLIVTAQNGDQQTYTVHIVREVLPEDQHTTKLMDLDVVSYEDTFTPRFHSLIDDYDIDILRGEISLVLSYIPYDSSVNVTLSINNDKSLIDQDSNTINYIDEDTDTITVTVTLPDELVDPTNPDTEPTVYTITYHKVKTVVAVADTFTCTKEPQVWVAPYTGVFTFEAWGASGGNGLYASYSNIELGGLGAYTSGNISLEEGQEIYIYVGCRGTNASSKSQHTTIAGGYNGGGGGVSGGTDDQAASGGGATDFRLVDGNWDDAESLASRIMVAAGGGGGHSYANTNRSARELFPGMAGQALSFSGTIGQWNGGSRSVTTNQTTGGAFGYGTKYTSLEGVHGAGGGGGGYYGGAANTNGNGGPGAGGTSFISGYTGSVAITSATSTSPKQILDKQGNLITCADETTNRECSIHYSGLKFYNGVMKSGIESMPTHNGESVMTGNDGDGYALISKTKADRDNYLLSLSVTVGREFTTDTFDPTTIEYLPVFDKFTNTYSMELPDYVTELSIAARLSSDNADIEGLGKHEVKAGLNTYNIVVTAESGEENIYTLNVTRPASDNKLARYIDVTGFVNSICKGHEGYCTLTPSTFGKTTYGYSLKIPAGIRELEWTVTKDHAYQKVIGDGVTRLGPNLNLVTIEVVSESENDSQTYTYSVFRDMTGDNYLDQINIYNPELTKDEFDFNYLVTEYSFRVDNSITELDMSVVTDDPNATYEIIGNENFEVGPNIVEIIVTSAPDSNGNTENRSYVLNVYRLANSNKLLSSLQVFNKGVEIPLTPPFEDIVTSYTIDVPNDVDNIDITATAAYNKTKIQGTGNKKLNTGLNQIPIITTAENGDTETYMIIVNRAKSTNAYLSILKPIDNKLSFNESFVKTNNNYTITVDPYTKQLGLNISTEDSTATYKVNGNNNFKIGPNKVEIVVTAEAGNTNKYVIIVTKEASLINTLATLTTNRGEVSPTFDPDHNNYTITVENDITTIDISGTMTDTLSRVVGFGTYKLTTGDNLIPITVTSESGASNTYVVNVFRKYNSNNKLATLTVSQGTLNPGFDPDEIDYTVNVGDEVEQITVNGTLQVPKTSSVTGFGTYNLQYGENTIEVKVTSEDKETKTYTIKVTRDKSSNTNLKTLVVKEGRLNKEFNPMVLGYTVKVMSDITSVNVLAIPEDPDATVTIDGGTSLVPGDNTVTVTVEAPNGDKKTYTITVFQADRTGLFLESLSATGCTINFVYNSYYYECEVDNLVTSTTIEAEMDADSKAEKASLSGTGDQNLKVGLNVFPVVVTSEDGEYERVYNVAITRLKSPESRLSKLWVTDHELSDTFDKDNHYYSLTTNEYELDIHYETINEGATVEIIGNDNLALGENTIEVKVTSEDGLNTTSYYLTVTRTIRNNNYLSNLWVEDEEISPEFNKVVTGYKLTVPYETNTVIIRATAEDRNAVIEGVGMKTLIPGPNTFTIRVRAENGEVKEYRLTVTRLASPNNYLASLSVTGETISPVFNKLTQNYTLAVPYETDTIEIVAETEDEDASIIGDGFVSLKQGVNNVTIYVTAANGNVRTYTIKVTRKDPITAKLLNIEVENYELDPKFTPDNQLYEVTVDYETTKLNFIITRMDPYSTYEIVGNKNFKIGMNEVLINVTSSNRIDTFQYRVIVNRQSYSNTFLSYLSVNQGELSPSFDKTTLTYSVDVPNGVEYITLDGAPDYPLSTVSGLKDYHLNVGVNSLKVVVTSPAGIKRTYTVNVNRRKSSNADITSIKANIGKLTKDDDYTYTLVVPKYTTNIGKANFTVTTADPLATVSMPVTIDLSQNTAYPIKVTSPDGTRTKEYTVNVVFDLSHDGTLALLEPSVGELDPVFNPKTNNYRIDLFDDEVEEYFDLYLSEVEATLLNRSLTYQLTELETTAEINIQAEDGSINTYTILIAKSKTKEQYLSNIVVTGVTDIDPSITLPSFRAKIFEYSLDVPYEVESIGFDITKRHYAQKIKIYKNDELQTGDSYSLNVGENVFRIEAINSLDEVTTYTYVINRAKSTNTNLSSLKFTSPEYEFTEFNKDILNYSAVIDFEYEGVVIEAIPEVPGTDIKINGATNIQPNEERDITIKVTAPAGNSKTYTITVLRLPEVNNLLRTLTVSTHGTIAELNPKFRPGTGDYTLRVSSSISSVQLEAYAFENDGFVYEYEEGMNIAEKIQDPSVRYFFEKEYPLEVGHNIITINATVLDEGIPVSKTYTIDIERLDTHNAYLESIIIGNGTLLEDFVKTNTGLYHVLVENDVTELQLRAIPEDRDATVNIIGNQELGYGKDNEITIKVTAADGSTAMSYYLKVEVKGEGNNYLSDLSINGETIEGFNKYIEEYFVTVENDPDRLVIGAVPEKDTAEVTSGVGVQVLDVGENTIDIVVEAQDGTPKTYTINITREEDAYLSGIVTDRGGAVADFDKKKYEYTIIVENDIEDITIIGWANDPINAEVTGNDKYENLKVGDNPIYLAVTNGSTRKVYTVTVKRKGSSNTNLLYLYSSDGDFEEAFTNDNDEYEMHIPNYKTKLALAYEVEHNATVSIVDNELSGTESTVKVIVTAEDGTTRTILIKVYLEDGSYFNSRLGDLSVKETTISPKFDPDTLSYTATVAMDFEKVHIVAPPEEDTSTVTGDGEVTLNLGRNEREIVVTAKDGSQTKYKLVIFRKDVDNADLTGLYTDLGELSPEFNPKVYNYSIDVPEETVKVHLTAVAYSEKTIEGDGDVYLQKGATVRNIVVTSESGITNTYKVTINRALSTNHDITNITEHTNTMDPYESTTLEYNFTVGDVSTINGTVVPTNHILFNVSTYSPLAEVIYEKEVEGERITLDGKDVSLDYGDNKIIIYAMSEDGNTSDEYVVNVHRIHDLTDITVPGDVTGPDMIDGSKNHISVQPGGTFDLLSEIKYTPEDADFKELTFKSNNTSIVTIDANGIITAPDILDKSTTITIQSKTYPSIIKTINVTVEITLITSDVYTIEREDSNYDPYITYIELKTPISTFFSNLDNDERFLHMYDTKGNEITDKTKLVGTGYQVRLENNGHTYDTLDIVVMGDINGDGYSNAQDLTFINNHILGKSRLTGVKLLAGDINHDGYINAQDLTYFKNYILGKRSSYLNV